MKKNMGTIDRIIRFILAIGVGVIYYLGLISGPIAIVIGVISIIFIATSFISFCPIYAAVKFRTNKEVKK